MSTTVCLCSFYNCYFADSTLFTCFGSCFYHIYARCHPFSAKVVSVPCKCSSIASSLFHESFGICFTFICGNCTLPKLRKKLGLQSRSVPVSCFKLGTPMNIWFARAESFGICFLPSFAGIVLCQNSEKRAV